MNQEQHCLEFSAEEIEIINKYRRVAPGDKEQVRERIDLYARIGDKLKEDPNFKQYVEKKLKECLGL